MVSHVDRRSIYTGRFIHCKDLENLETFDLVAVDENGKIVAVEKEGGAENVIPIIGKLNWNAESTTIYRAAENQFYFPGFIGISWILSNFLHQTTDRDRYAYTRFTVPKCRHLRQVNTSRLVEHIHVPTRVFTLLCNNSRRSKSQESLFSLYITYAFARYNDRSILRHHRHRKHQSSRRFMSCTWSTSFHRSLLYGLGSPAEILS